MQSSAPLRLEAKRYEGKIKGGNLLISVHLEAADERTRAEKILKPAKAGDICSTAESSVPNKNKDRTSKNKDRTSMP